LLGQDVDGEEKWDGKLPENEVQEDGVRMPDKTTDAPNQDGTIPASGEIEDDITLILNFQERSLREFVRAAEVPELLRTPALQSYMDLFGTTVNLLCGAEENDPVLQDARIDLQNYAAFSWLKHFIDLTDDDINEFALNESQVIAVAESLYCITSNQNNASQVIAQHSDVSYDDFTDDLKSVPEKIQDLLRRYLACTKFALQPDTVPWAKRILRDPTDALQPLARGHVVHWFQQRLKEPAIQAYKIASKAFKTVRFHLLNTSVL
jgi:hypothetical protein